MEIKKMKERNRLIFYKKQKITKKKGTYPHHHTQ
jgi:hypothetical protein